MLFVAAIWHSVARPEVVRVRHHNDQIRWRQLQHPGLVVSQTLSVPLTRRTELLAFFLVAEAPLRLFGEGCREVSHPSTARTEQLAFVVLEALMCFRGVGNRHFQTEVEGQMVFAVQTLAVHSATGFEKWNLRHILFLLANTMADYLQLFLPLEALVRSFGGKIEELTVLAGQTVAAHMTSSYLDSALSPVAELLLHFPGPGKGVLE